MIRLCREYFISSFICFDKLTKEGKGEFLSLSTDVASQVESWRNLHSLTKQAQQIFVSVVGDELSENYMVEA